MAAFQLEPNQVEYIELVERRRRGADRRVRARTVRAQASMAVTLLAGAGVTLTPAVTDVTWVAPTLGFLVVVSQGASRLLVRTGRNAPAADKLRRSLGASQRQLNANIGEYSDPSNAFKTFARETEDALDLYDREASAGVSAMLVDQDLGV